MLDYICKYVTPDGLIDILSNRRLKWSAPKTFNDPFDLQINVFNYDLDEFRRVAEEKISRIIFGEKNLQTKPRKYF